MASHYQHGADILPFGPIKDYPERFPVVRPRQDLPDPIEMLRASIVEREAQAEFNKDLRIIGYGLAFAYAWVVVFRIAQIVGVL